MMAPYEVHVLIPGICGCDTIPSPRDIAGVSKLRALWWRIDPKLSGGPVLSQGGRRVKGGSGEGAEAGA